MVESFQGTPDWYGGGAGILKKLVERAQADSLAKYQPYGAERVAPFTPLQEQGFSIAEKEAFNPEYQDIYKQSSGLIRDASGQDISSKIAPYLQAGTANPTTNAGQYMNPYQDAVVNNIGKYASRNLTENILPNVKDRFIRAGQYGSTGHQDLTGRAIRDTQEAVSQASANALQGGYNTALSTSVGQQGRNLEAGQLAAGVGDRDIGRKIVAGETLSNLGQAQQNQGFRSAGFLNTIGGQQQQQRQNVDNTAYQEFQNERNYPFFQTARLNEIVRGLPVNTQQFANAGNGPTAPTASPWTQGGGLLAGLTGATNQRPQGFAKGGIVKKVSHRYRHYAEGGGVPMSPIQRGVNSALDTEELKSMRDTARKLERPQTNPVWAAIARAGFNVAANRQPGVLAAIGQGANAGLDEYSTQLSRQDERGMGSAKIMEMIDNTRRMQSERDRKHQLDMEKFGQQQKEFGMTHSINSAKLGMEREKHKIDMNRKNLITGKDGMLYELVRGTDGEMTARPLEGITAVKSSKQLAENKKINDEEKKNAINVIKGFESNKKTIENLRDANKKLKTPAWEASLAEVPIIGKPAASVSKALLRDSTALNNLETGSNQLVVNKYTTTPGKQSVALFNAMMEGKPGKYKSYEANENILNDEVANEAIKYERAQFLLDTLKKYKDNFNAGEIQLAYDKYRNDKMEYEKTHKEPFPKTPEDFLMDEAQEEGNSPSNKGEKDSEISNEDLVNGISNLIG